jgi:hypothetical protein
MIKYALACEHEHLFEGWFGSSVDYDDQSARSLVDCPVCGSKTVRKQIMAPAVAGTRKRELTVPDPRMRAMMMEAVGKMRRHVEDNFDYVGDTFAKEARAIHDGKSEDRGIYGEASPKEVKALVEDGIKIAPLPPKPPEDSELN